MSSLSIIIGFIITLVSSLIITPLTIKFAKRIGIVDKPNDRKKHNGNIPLLGGVAVIVPVIIGLFYLQPQHYSMVAIIIGAIIIITIGLLDDIYSLKPLTKLIAQITAAVVVMSSGLMIEKLTVPLIGSVDLGVFSYVITILWIVGITNAMNLIDGLDGLASGVAAIAFASIFVMAIGDGIEVVVFMSIVMLASLIGFLIFNFYPAKIFLGDVGSLFIGYSLSVISMLGLFKNVTVFSFIVPIIVLTIPIFDTIFAIVRRAINKQHIMTADRKHIHYVLLDLGFGHKNTVLLIYAFSAVFGAIAIIFTNATTIFALVIMLVMVTIIHLLAELTGCVRGGRTPVLNSLKKILKLKV